MERFKMNLGCNYNPEYLAGLSDEELAEEIRKSSEWDADLLRDLCWRADIDIDDVDESVLESCYDAAAEKLGVEIY